MQAFLVVLEDYFCFLLRAFLQSHLTRVCSSAIREGCGRKQCWVIWLLQVKQPWFANQILPKDDGEDVDYHDLIGHGHPYDWKQGVYFLEWKS